jgi:hypothetical protein
MMHSLTLHADAWISDGPAYASGPVIGYRVGGMPSGEESKIQNLGGPETPAWRILRISNGESSEFEGRFDNAEDALAALQSAVSWFFRACEMAETLDYCCYFRRTAKQQTIWWTGWRRTRFESRTLELQTAMKRDMELTKQHFAEAQYSTPQQKMLYLYDTLREALRFKKYYAQGMKRCEHWNLVSDIVIAVAASSSLTNVLVSSSTNWLLTVMLAFSAAASLLKPILKLNKRAARFSRLQRNYLALYQKLERLRKEIQHNARMLPTHETRFARLRDRFDSLGLQNEPVESNKRMLKIQDDIESAIPTSTLWLPISEWATIGERHRHDLETATATAIANQKVSLTICSRTKSQRQFPKDGVTRLHVNGSNRHHQLRSERRTLNV